jgi:hypothetical protein
MRMLVTTTTKTLFIALGEQGRFPPFFWVSLSSTPKQRWEIGPKWQKKLWKKTRPLSGY